MKGDKGHEEDCKRRRGKENAGKTQERESLVLRIDRH